MRPWRMVGSTRLALVRERLRGALGAWSTHWGFVSNPDAVVWIPAADFPAEGRPPADWMCVSAGGQRVHLWIEPVVPARFSAAVGQRDTDSPSPLWREVVGCAIADLGARFLVTDGAPTAEVVRFDPAPEFWQRGSGGLLGRAQLGCGALLLATDDALVRHISAAAPLPAGPAPALENPWHGIQSGRVELSFLLGEVELPISALDSLAPGDLIPLPARVSDLVEVRVQNLPTGLRAYPGRRGGQLAVQLCAGRD